jgi:hypothetical protein
LLKAARFKSVHQNRMHVTQEPGFSSIFASGFEKVIQIARMPAFSHCIFYCKMPKSPRFRRSLALCSALGLFSVGMRASHASDYESKIKPILSKYCYDCHGDGMSKGNVTLDEFKSDADIIAARDEWFHVLKNVRAGIMPPQK